MGSRVVAGDRARGDRGPRRRTGGLEDATIDAHERRGRRIAVAPGQGAVWTQAREGGVERVELSAGTLRVRVRPQGAGERFLVRLPDGEIEVRGTTFEVTARDGTTSHVSVDEGTVVLRLRGSPDRSLGPGTSWPFAEAAGSQKAVAAGSRDAFTAGGASPVSMVSTAVPAASIGAPTASIPRRSSADAHDGDQGASLYVEAMRSFREGRYDGAAAAFHAFTLAYPRAGEAEDASFLEALSLARAGRADAAALAAERHLEAFPRSFRRREASVLVARAASHRGRCDEALEVLAPWISAPPDADVRSVLQACGDGNAPP
jgi:TolA-binding protein